MYLKDNSKGQIFSIITLLMVIPIVALTITFSESMSDYGGELGSRMRLKSGYYYYYSLESDIGRSSEIIGERALLTVINEVVAEGEGLDQPSEKIYELFVNGTINDEEKPLMNRTGIDDWLASAEEISEIRNFNLNLYDLNVDIEMSDPFNLGFNLDYGLYLEDEHDLFSLQKNRSRTVPISVEGYEDPLVTLGTDGRLYIPIEDCGFDYLTEQIVTGTGNNSWSVGETIVLPSEEQTIEDVEHKDSKVLVTEEKIDQSIIEEFSAAVIGEYVDELDIPYVSDVNIYSLPNETRVVVDGNYNEVWEIENLYDMWDETCYYSGTGPSFIERLQYDLESTSNQGMSVFLNKGELDAYGIDVRDRSNLAHVYFSDIETNDCKVKGMPDSFRIDESSLSEYGLDNILSYDC